MPNIKNSITEERTRVSPKTLYRLLVYQRILNKFFLNDLETVRSAALAKASGVKPEQLRKDLALFGQVGTRGLGYPVKELMDVIRAFLGKTDLQPVILIGTGNLGSALLKYGGFKRAGFDLVAAFDVQKGGQSKDVLPMSELQGYIEEHSIELAVLCVPQDAAQEVADELISYGITGLLNFTSMVLQVPSNISVNNVDLALELENLSFFVSQQNGIPS